MQNPKEERSMVDLRLLNKLERKINKSESTDPLTYYCKNAIFSIPIEKKEYLPHEDLILHEDVEFDPEYHRHEVVSSTSIHQLHFSGKIKFFNHGGQINGAVRRFDDLIPSQNHFEDFEPEEIKSIFVNYLWNCEEINYLYENAKEGDCDI